MHNLGFECKIDGLADFSLINELINITKFLGVLESKDFLKEFTSIKLSNIVFAGGPEALTLKVSLEFNNEVQSQ